MYYSKGVVFMYKSKGFTIVEILIVIAVIGILATISVVAYNGAVEKAHNVTIATTVENYSKAASLYFASERKWPLQTSPSSNAACIGSPKSYETTYGYLTPGICSTLVGASADSQFDSQLSAYISDAPDLSFMEPLQYTPSQKYGRGIYYTVNCLPSYCSTATTPASEVEVTISYVVRSSKKCVIGDSLANTPITGFTTCIYYVQHGAA